MRPGQNKRMRGRNNRKGPNPLTRTYESNGPDVKIRGTAHHVAEKYLQLARDAHSSGDPVMAESYLQHAEHYFRLIAAAQQAQQQASAGFLRGPGETPADLDDGEDDDDFGGVADRFASPQERAPAPPTLNQPQPAPYQGQPQPFVDKQSDRQPYQDRGPRPDRPFQDRNGQNRQRGGRDQRPPRDFSPDQPRYEPRGEQRATAEDPAAGLPAFITGGGARAAGPARETEREESAALPGGAANAQPFGPEGEAEHDTASYHLRSRRRRRRPAADGTPESAPVDQKAPGELPVGE